MSEETEYNLFEMNLDPCNGEIFFLENIETSDAMVVISETPDYQTTTLKIKKGVVSIENGGNGLIVEHCKMGKCEAFCRKYLRNIHKTDKLVTMSNTWGDCNGFSRVCESFFIKEIDAAEEIGIDIVQIDDGWQTGNTADMSLRDEYNRRNSRATSGSLTEQNFQKE